MTPKEGGSEWQAVKGELLTAIAQGNQAVKSELRDAIAQSVQAVKSELLTAIEQGNQAVKSELRDAIEQSVQAVKSELLTAIEQGDQAVKSELRDAIQASAEETRRMWQAEMRDFRAELTAALAEMRIQIGADLRRELGNLRDEMGGRRKGVEIIAVQLLSP